MGHGLAIPPIPQGLASHATRAEPREVGEGAEKGPSKAWHASDEVEEGLGLWLLKVINWPVV